MKEIKIVDIHEIGLCQKREAHGYVDKILTKLEKLCWRPATPDETRTVTRELSSAGGLSVDVVISLSGFGPFFALRRVRSTNQYVESDFNRQDITGRIGQFFAVVPLNKEQSQ